MISRPFRWVSRLALVAGLSLLVFAPAAALAQTSGPGYPSPSVSTTTDPCPPTGTTAPNVCNVSNVSVKAAQTTSSGSLPFTGANIALLVGLGLVATAGGVVLVRFGRRADVSS